MSYGSPAQQRVDQSRMYFAPCLKRHSSQMSCATTMLAAWLLTCSWSRFACSQSFAPPALAFGGIDRAITNVVHHLRDLDVEGRVEDRLPLIDVEGVQSTDRRRGADRLYSELPLRWLGGSRAGA